MANHAAGRAGTGPWIGGWHLVIPLVALAAFRDLWAPDEPRYAQIAREAFESGEWLVLHLCGDVYPDKPPLVYWLAGLCGTLGGWSAFALRLPLILATIGSALLAARIARRHLGPIAAAWTPVFYLGTAMVAWFGGRLQLDPLLAFFCLAAVDLAWNDAGTSAQRGRRLVLAGLCTGLAALCKGPVAWMHVGFALAALRCVPSASRAPLRASAIAWVGFVALAVLPVATWAVAASLREPSLWRPLFLGQHVGRALDSEAPHSGPPWEHVWQLPALFLPWTGLLVLGIVEVVRAWRPAERAGPRAAALVRMSAWFVPVFVVFSAMPPKRELYLLPLYPVCAWFAAVAFERALVTGKLTRWATVPATVIFLLGGLAAIVLPYAVDRIRPFAPGALAVALPLLASSVCGFVFLKRGAFARWADAIALGMTGAALAAAIWVIPDVDPMKSARGLAEIVAQRPEKPARIPCIEVQPEGYRFYGRVPTVRSHAGALLQDLESGGPDHMALITEKAWDRLPETTRARFAILERRQVGSRAVLVIGRAAASGT